MPTPRVGMRKIKECLRLKLECGLSNEQVARALGLSKGVVGKYVGRARVRGLDWATLSGLDERGIEAELCPPVATTRGERAPIDLAWVHRCQRPPQWRHFRIGIKAPLQDRRNGATPGSAQRRHFRIGVMAPPEDRHIGARVS